MTRGAHETGETMKLKGKQKVTCEKKGFWWPNRWVVKSCELGKECGYIYRSNYYNGFLKNFHFPKKQ